LCKTSFGWEKRSYCLDIFAGGLSLGCIFHFSSKCFLHSLSSFIFFFKFPLYFRDSNNTPPGGGRLVAPPFAPSPSSYFYNSSLVSLTKFPSMYNVSSLKRDLFFNRMIWQNIWKLAKCRGWINVRMTSQKIYMYMSWMDYYQMLRHHPVVTSLSGCWVRIAAMLRRYYFIKTWCFVSTLV